MKHRVFAATVAVALICVASAFAGSDRVSTRFVRTDELDAPSFEISTESTYMLGCFGNPHAYEIAAQYVTARLRWGAIHDPDSWLRGYNQVYFLAMGEYFARGLENHYFGVSSGLRYNFVRPNSRFVPYISGGVGLGFVDATRVRESGALGQDFTFNILTAIGVSYKLNDQWRATAGVQYQHLSNAGMSEPERPNSSLNSVGPELGITYTF
jgi:opacity protein-like surface antigen